MVKNISTNMQNMEFVSEEQKQIVTDNARIKLVNGVAGSGKSSTLIKCGIRYLAEGKNVIFLTKISSVTDELTKRMYRDYGIVFNKSASHFLGQYTPGTAGSDSDRATGPWVSVSNYDSFIDKQLRVYDIPFEGEAFNQKVKQLTKNIDRMDRGIFMKNDQPIDVVLIDEVQDFDSIRIALTTAMFNRFTGLIGVFVGDTLQTVFIQSIMGESFSMNYIKTNLECKYYELSMCYRCPKSQVDFVNQVMGPYQERYGIGRVRSNNDNTTDKPVIFQHHSVHKEYERADLCRRVIYIIDYVLNKDSTISPDDIVVVMNKTNSNAVFEKLLVEVNRYYRARYQNGAYENVIHYKTKNQEGRKTIDWSIGENKTKFISVHGIKGKGQRVVILLGMSEKSIPMMEWLFKTEELVSQSVMNVALTRSEKFLFVGVNTIPSRYINDALPSAKAERTAYLSWDKDTYTCDDVVPFYKDLLVGFEQFDTFDFVTDKYTRDVIHTPSKSVLAIKEDIVQEYHISDCIRNAFALTSEEVMQKVKFGKRLYVKPTMNIVERAVLGVLGEMLVGRYMRVYTKNVHYDNAFLWSYYGAVGTVGDGSVGTGQFLYTNHQNLLNLVFDTKINSYVKDHARWWKEFTTIKTRTRHMKALRDLLGGVTRPVYILDNAFEKMNVKSLLDIYFSSKPNESIWTTTYWNLALFHCALSGHYKMTSVMMFINGYNGNLSPLHANVKTYCHTYLLNSLSTHKLSFQKQILVLKHISDPEVLATLNPDILEREEGKRVYRYGFMGISDIVQERTDCDKRTATLHEIKCISSSDPAKVKTWIFQSVLYSYLLKKLSSKTQNDIERIVIVNLLSGYIWEFDMGKVTIRYRDMIEYIMQQKHFPQQLITDFLATGPE
jgi:thymidine kinase